MKRLLNEYVLSLLRNPKATVQRTNKKVNNDSTLRIQNLSILIKQIKSYYQVSEQSFQMEESAAFEGVGADDTEDMAVGGLLC